MTNRNLPDDNNPGLVSHEFEETGKFMPGARFGCIICMSGWSQTTMYHNRIVLTIVHESRFYEEPQLGIFTRVWFGVKKAVFVALRKEPALFEPALGSLGLVMKETKVYQNSVGEEALPAYTAAASTPQLPGSEEVPLFRSERETYGPAYQHVPGLRRQQISFAITMSILGCGLILSYLVHLFLG